MRTGLVMLFANVTSLSTRILDYLRGVRDEFHFVGLAEHKKLEHDIPAAQDKFKAMGYKSWWTQAKVKEAGASGGTSIHIHRCFVGKRLDWSAIPSGRVLPVEAANWTGVIVHGHINFVIIVAYLKDGVGMNSENLALVADMVAWILATGLPWFIAADWNMTPTELIQSAALRELHAEVIVPMQCELTCSMGKGRMLDYVLTSRSLAPLIRVHPEYLAPVKPHTAIRVEIDLEPLSDKIRVLSTPHNPVVLPIKKKEHQTDMNIPDDPALQAKRRKLPRAGVKRTLEASGQAVEDASLEAAAVQDISWEEARVIAGSMIGAGSTGAEDCAEAFAEANRRYAGKSEMLESLAFVLERQDAIDLGADYCGMITTAEVYLGSRDPRLKDDLGKAVGRAKGPRYKVISVKDHLGCKGSIEELGASREVKLWAIIAAKMAMVDKLIHGGSPTPARRTQAESIKNAIASAVHELAGVAHQSKDRQKIARSDKWKRFLDTWSSLTRQVFKIFMEEAAEVLRLEMTLATRESRNRFVEWQRRDSEDNHSKGMYAWVRKATQKLVEGDLVHNGMVVVSNAASCISRAEPWCELWQQGVDHTTAFCTELSQAWNFLVECRKAERLPKRTMEQLHTAIFTFKRHTGRGSDDIGPDFIKALPYKAKLELLDLFNMIQVRGVWPWQWLHIIIALIPKASDGDRPIGLSPMLMRLFFRMHKDYSQEWEASMHGAWDTAIKGSSALRAALKRALQIECAVAEEECFALILLDIQKFFDSIPLAALIRAGIALGYSPTLLGLNVLACLALRTLKSACGSSSEIQAYRSIVAGLGEACNLARMIIYQVCERYSADHPTVPLKTFVDDMSQLVRGRAERVAMEAMTAAKALTIGLQEAGFVISKKSQLLTNCSRTKHLVRSGLKAVNVEINVVDQAVDLGLDLSATAKKGFAKRSARTKLAMAKSERIACLQSRHHRLNFTKGITVAQASYGTEAVGLSPEQARVLRSKVTSALGYKQGMCPTSLLEINKEQDPVAALRWRQVKEWIHLWLESPELHKEIRRTWKTMHSKLIGIESSARRWQAAHGVVGGMISALTDIGWQAEEPDQWVTPENTLWWMAQDPMDLNHIRKEFFRLSQLTAWAKASRHHNGSGAQDGVVMEHAQKLRGRLKRQGHVIEAGLLDSIVAAGLWTNERCSDAGYTIDKRCPLCGYQNDGEGHRMWHCEVIKQSQDKDIVGSNHLIKDAVKLDPDVDDSGLMRWQRIPCFWIRSLIPSKWFSVEAPSEQKLWLNGICQEAIWCTGGRHVYIDESAGEFSANPWLRRAGWGMVILGADRQVIGAASGTQPGEDQTQTMAVLSAVLYLLKNSQGDVVIRPDCNMAVEGLQEVLKGNLTQFGSYAQMWHDIDGALGRRQGAVNVKRVDAHVDVREYLDKGYPVEDWLGNELADFLAGNAARANGPPLQMVTDWEFFNGRAVKILKRAIAVNKLFLDRPGAGVGPRGTWQVVEHPVHQAIRLSGHQLIKDDRGAFQCLACEQRASHSQLKAWLCKGPCMAVQKVGPDGLCAPDHRSEIIIGRGKVHQSHRLAWKRGIWFCTTCGSFARAALNAKSNCRKLTVPCESATPSGSKVLKRIAAGLTPLHGVRWPSVDYQQAYQKAQSLEELWPDLRKGSKGDKKRRAHHGLAESKFRCVEVDGSPEHHLQSSDDAGRLEDVNDEQGLQMHYDLKGEDEDPWGDQDRDWQPF